MIKISVKPRQDNLFDIYVGDEGDHFLNSDQGYENVEDAEAIVRRCWPPMPSVDEIRESRPEIPRRFIETMKALLAPEPVVLVVTYRNGKTKTEQLR